MSNIHPFPRQEQRYDEASAWIAKLDKGLSDAETESLRTWMAAEARNTDVLLSMAGMWDKLDTLSRLTALFPEPAHPRRRRMRYPLAIAASVLVAALIGVWSQLGPNPFPWPGSGSQAGIAEVAATAAGAYETAIGEKSTVMLPDGTQVVLNTNSLLHVEYTSVHRLLTLERGEVNVRVAKDPLRPLSVVAGDQVFQAVGTAFNVEIIEGRRIELVVTEGRVRVGVQTRRAPDSRARETPEVLAASARTVAAGEVMLLGTSGEEVTPVSPEEIEVRLSWRDGNLIFRGESLEEALEEVGRYTSVEFVFVDDDVRRRTVAGRFKAGDVEGLLATLQSNLDIVYERVDDQTVLLASK